MQPDSAVTDWRCPSCGHWNTGFASACYGGCGKDRPAREGEDQGPLEYAEELEFALRKCDELASVAHDYLWELNGVTKQQANKAIWTIHEIVSAATRRPETLPEFFGSVVGSEEERAFADRVLRDIEKLRRALAYYADPANYSPDDWGIRAVVDEYGDAGRRARATGRALRRLLG